MTRRRDGIERRDAILDAALGCFSEYGVLGTGIENIRRQAGASPSSVYNLFDDLNGIILALLDRTFGRLFAHLGGRVTSTTTAEEAVVGLVGGHIEWVLEHRAEARFMYQAMALELSVSGRDQLQARKAELLAPVAAHLMRFMAEGSLPTWSPLVFDVVLFGPTHESCRRFLAGADLDPRWMLSTLPRLAWQSVCREGRADGSA